MAVQGRFGVAGGAAGVAHAGGRIFIKNRPLVSVGLPTYPGLVADQAGNAGVGGQLIGVAKGHIVPDGAALAVDSLHQRQKTHVKAQHLVFGVVGYPGNQIGVQSRVDGVQHPARAADAVIQLKVAVAVPGQCGHPVAELQPHGVQGIGHLACAAGSVFVGVTVNIAFHTARDDIHVRVMAFCEINQV